ncbi:MAG: hypothetical protein E6I76_08730 [Chloroflexi bacterium]|nr:MAG: hypothetical protein E6I76_08730 [Chloroflexota bacterium]
MADGSTPATSPSTTRTASSTTADARRSRCDQHPAVQESAACAVQSELGEDEVKVCIVPQPGAQPTPEEIVDFCSGRMAYYAIPRYVEIVDSLPKTETQRIQYGILRQRGITPATWDRQTAGHTVERR